MVLRCLCDAIFTTFAGVALPPHTPCMKATLQYARDKFRLFNGLYFSSELPEPTFALSAARTYLGQFSCRRSRRWLSFRAVPSDFTIRLSVRYDLSERELQSVLLHEMIHFYIAYKGIRDTSAHGRVFRSMMDALNTCHGWSITISSRGHSLRPAAASQAHRRLVLALTTTDGRYWLSVVNPGYRAAIDRKARAAATVSSHVWIETDDSFFCDFPAVRSLRGRKVARETFLRVTGGRL